MEGCFMLNGTFHNIYHTLTKGHYTLSKEYCIHNKALFWIKLSDYNMQLQTNWFDILCMYPEHFLTYVDHFEKVWLKISKYHCFQNEHVKLFKASQTLEEGIQGSKSIK